MGWLRRAHGLTIDNLVAAEVVTADGDRRPRPTEDEHPELFWALRGGGGNFGVVTSFEYRLHPVGPDVAVAFVLYPGRARRRGDGRVRRVHGRGAGEVSPLLLPRACPAGRRCSRRRRTGSRTSRSRACIPAPSRRASEVLRPLRELGDPIVDLSDAMPYVEAQQLLDEDYPDGWQYYWKSLELDGARPRGRPPARRARGRRAVRPLDDRRLVARRRDGPRPGGGDGVRRPADDPARVRGELRGPGRGGRRTSPGCAARSRSCGRSRPAAPTSTSPASSRRATSCCARRSARRTTSASWR